MRNGGGNVTTFTGALTNVASKKYLRRLTVINATNYSDHFRRKIN
jgi:hypothetical protein